MKIKLKIKEQFRNDFFKEKVKESELKSLNLNSIKKYYHDPVLKLIENEGYNDDGILIADINGLKVISEIIESIMFSTKKDDGTLMGSIEIIEKHTLEESCEVEEVEIEETSEIEIIENDDEDLDNEPEDEIEEEETEETEEEDFEECLEEYRECDSYIDNLEDDNMNDE